MFIASHSWLAATPCGLLSPPCQGSTGLARLLPVADLTTHGPQKLASHRFGMQPAYQPATTKVGMPYHMASAAVGKSEEAGGTKVDRGSEATSQHQMYQIESNHKRYAIAIAG
jgi:hypothetical protein